jgi:hypothetical protein
MKGEIAKRNKNKGKTCIMPDKEIQMAVNRRVRMKLLNP